MTPLPPIAAYDRLFLHDNPNTDDVVEWIQQYATAAVADAVADERAACALLCDEYALKSSNPMNFSENCADAIRARASSGTATAKNDLIVGQSSGTEKP